MVGHWLCVWGIVISGKQATKGSIYTIIITFSDTLKTNTMWSFLNQSRVYCFITCSLYRQTDRQTDRRTDRQTDIQTDRDIQTD